MTKTNSNEGKTGGAPVAVFKESGVCEYFFVLDYILEGVFDKLKHIDLSALNIN